MTFFNPIMVGTSVLVFSLLALCIGSPTTFYSLLVWIQNIFVLYFSWFYVWLFFFAFCFCLFWAFGPYKKVRLGQKGSRPKYSLWTWLAMLFSAGMGTGLLFSGVYEPLYHYFYPPIGEGATPKSLELSFQLTFLHWGFSGWAVYTLMGLGFAYFSFCKKKPARQISNMLPPFFKNKVKGLASVVDVLSITVILFGVSATLGRGALQINSGLKEFFNLPYSPLVQSGIILLVTLLAVASLLSGLNKGMRFLSELNLMVCLGLLVFIFWAGPSLTLLNSFVQHTGHYLQNLVSLMTHTSLGSLEWRSQWTILYWAWWMAWAPFVGLFIARISEGRTIQQLVLGGLFAPTLLSCFWFVVLGGSAIQYHLDGTMNLKNLLKTEYSMAFFAFLKSLPWAGGISILALFAVVVFFVTSSDSASYVIHRMAHKKTRTLNKVYWCALEGALALLLIYFGGMKSLELLVIVLALPFSIVFCLLCYSFFREITRGQKD